MKSVKLREFRDHLGTFLDDGEPLIITRHGEVIGANIPFRKVNKAASTRSAEKLAATLEAIYAETGMSEDEFVAAFLTADDSASANRSDLDPPTS